jgi:hypothetical protein
MHSCTSEWITCANWKTVRWIENSRSKFQIPRFKFQDPKFKGTLLVCKLFRLSFKTFTLKPQNDFELNLTARNPNLNLKSFLTIDPILQTGDPEQITIDILYGEFTCAPRFIFNGRGDLNT